MHTYSGSRIHSEEKVVIHCTAHLLSLLSGKSGPSKGALDFFFLFRVWCNCTLPKRTSTRSFTAPMILKVV